MLEIAVLQKGGVMMFALLALSVYAVGVVLFKLWQFKRANVFDRSFIEPVMREIKQGDRAKAQKMLADLSGPIAHIMRVTFEAVLNRDMSQKSREAEITRVGSGDVRYLESHLRGLEMAAQVAPLMGLLGTVMGLIASFAKLGQAGNRVDPTMLAGGIWEALLTTAGGLAVAIPALAAHYVLDGVVEKVRSTMKDVSVQILALEDEFRRNERLRAIEEARRIEAERMAMEQRMREEQAAREEQLRQEQAAREERERRDREWYERERREQEAEERQERLKIMRELRGAAAQAQAQVQAQAQAQAQTQAQAQAVPTHMKLHVQTEAEELPVKPKQKTSAAPELPETLQALNPNYSRV